MSQKIGVAVMALLLGLYLVVVVRLAITLILIDDTIARGIGIALIVLPLLGAWALVVEILFGIRSQRLVEMLEGEGALPADSLPKLTSGRPERAAADAEFPTYRAEVEAQPESWRAWFRLGLAYDASGDRRRARDAIRKAIALQRRAR
ncbi:MAG: conserved rane protein [Homoserinimonas sp.]|nr:conserved rane protein [Homoserinimonas sp.]